MIFAPGKERVYRMNIEKRSARFGAAILIFAILTRLLGFVSTPRAQAEGFLPHRPSGGISMGTGTIPVTTIPTTVFQPTTIPTQPPQLPTQPPLPPAAVIAQADMDLVRFRYATDCPHQTQLQPLLLQPLVWQLAGDEPTVLILHSHASESYTRQPGQEYAETSDYRTLDLEYNMVAVGDTLAALLEAAGIGVIHDRQIHDYPSYNQAYDNSRRSVESYLEAYPSIRLVLDLHRDAALNADGSQYATSATVDGQKAAQLMLLIGSDPGSGIHPNWEENLALALKMQVVLEKENPGITRRTVLRGCTFHQELSSGMLIVEVGTAGNTLQEAKLAMQPLAAAIIALQSGANV